jgi:hypothetical protein
LKDRAKCAGETPLTAAKRSTDHGSCDAASILSLARSSLRNNEGVLIASAFAMAKE